MIINFHFSFHIYLPNCHSVCSSFLPKYLSFCQIPTLWLKSFLYCFLWHRFRHYRWRFPFIFVCLGMFVFHLESWGIFFLGRKLSLDRYLFFFPQPFIFSLPFFSDEKLTIIFNIILLCIMCHFSLASFKIFS